MTAGRLRWYWRRARRMSAGEVAHRASERARRRAWRRRQVRSWDAVAPGRLAGRRDFPVALPADTTRSVPAAARAALLRAADRVLEGPWDVLGTVRSDLDSPDWFRDPVTGRRAPQETCAFEIDHRREEVVGNVKQVWEVSRHHHLTVLAAAWSLSREERYATAVDRQLRSWWRENLFLSGIHWTSGLELAIRLISWTWIRRLMVGWPGVAALFEENPSAARQLRWHQQYLAAFPSIGSSANNHAVGEAAGRFVAACAFPWFPESARWRQESAKLLERELEHNTFPSGINRELASDYHRFVAELALVAVAEGEAVGHPLSDDTWGRLCLMLDSAAAMIDVGGRGPRQGDSDDGRVLLLDDPEANPWASFLALGAGLLGRQSWWPPPASDVRSTVVAAIAGDVRDVTGRPGRRPSHFADAGVTLLRTAGDPSEIWCRCDGGPHGFLSIAAHAHADALSLEVRHRGVDVLADPGTYCYHGEPSWRAYFRSTVAHSTLCLEGGDQSVSGGPFLWTAHAAGHVLEAVVDDDARVVSWSAEHDGYQRLRPAARHRRTVELDRERRVLTVEDRVIGEGSHGCRLCFHLGPSVSAALVDGVAQLEWPVEGGVATASLHLPSTLHWTLHRAEMDPVLGWYSPRFGVRQPAVALLGSGRCDADGAALVTRIEFHA